MSGFVVIKQFGDSQEIFGPIPVEQRELFKANLTTAGWLATMSPGELAKRKPDESMSDMPIALSRDRPILFFKKIHDLSELEL